MHINHINEMLKCVKDFEYFSSNYIKISHPTQGLINFKLFPWQKRLANDLEENKFLISTKWRHGGLVTTTLAYLFWKCITDCDQRILWLEKTRLEAINFAQEMKRMIEPLPEWLRPKTRQRKHEIEFTETGSRINFYSPQAAKSRALTHLVINEAAYIPNMEEHWKSAWPCLSCGGKAYILSTTTQRDLWFMEKYMDAVNNKNSFHVFKSDYKEHPLYQDQNYLKELKLLLGIEAFCREIEGKFVISTEDLLNFSEI